MKKRLIVVLGMHRAGTSAVTRALQVMGVDLGKNFLPVQADNPKGFWEDLDIISLNEEMLGFIKNEWHFLTPIQEKDVEVLRSHGYVTQAVELLRKKTGEDRIFGFKDPRVSKLLPFWKEVFAQDEYEVYYVLAIRHPLSVSRSLEKRDGFALEKCYALWLVHVINGFSGTQGAPRVVVDYDRLLQSPETELLRLAKGLNLTVDPAELEIFKHEFLDQELRHTVFKLEDMDLDGAALPLVRDVYLSALDAATDKASVDAPSFANAVQSWNRELVRLIPIMTYADKLETDVRLKNQGLIERDQLIRTKNQALMERDQLIRNHSQKIGDLTGVISNREEELSSLKMQMAGYEHQVNELFASRSWRITRPLRYVTDQFRRVYGIIDFIVSTLATYGFSSFVKKTLRVLRNAEGTEGIIKQIASIQLNSVEKDYLGWIERYDTFTQEDIVRIQREMELIVPPPKISILMPCYNSKPEWLREAIDSVIDQIYPYWELCIADDASKDPVSRQIIQEYAEQDKRIKYVFREVNGHISAASNSALSLAKGEYLALLDHDDKLHPLALFYVAQEIAAYPDSEVIYSDEDKLTETGHRTGPYFKPDFDYDLFLSQNMVSHLGVYKTDVVRRVGGFREGLEGSQDYDLALRVIEQVKPSQIRHIPRVLYHWRISAHSEASGGNAKPYAYNAAVRAIQEHFSRKNIAASVEVIPDMYSYRVRYAVPAPEPFVDIIIYACGLLPEARLCVDDILSTTTYSNFRISLYLNTDENFFNDASVRKWADDKRIQIVHGLELDKLRTINRIVRSSAAEYICLLDAMLFKFSPSWLHEMVGHASQPEVGAVGVKLLQSIGSVYSTGVILNQENILNYLYAGLPNKSAGYFGWAGLQRGFTVLPAACLLMKRAHFLLAGSQIYNNISIYEYGMMDLCLQLKEKGCRNIYIPMVELYFQNSVDARSVNENQKVLPDGLMKDKNYIKRRWHAWLEHDPAFNPNLSLLDGRVVIADVPRIRKA